MLNKRKIILEKAYQNQQELGGSGGILPPPHEVKMNDQAWNEAVIKLERDGLITGIKISHSSYNKRDGVKEVLQTKKTKVTEKGIEFLQQDE